MAHRVVLISEKGMEGWFGQTVLKRADIELHCTSDCHTAFQLVLRSDCRLVIAEDWPGCQNFQGLLSELLFSIRKDDFRVILVTNSMPMGPGQPPIAMVHHAHCKPDAFDRSVVEALGIRKRAGKRHLVRIHMSAASREEMNMGLAVCVVLNAGGMLLESPKPLPIGKSYFWSFQGIPELKDLRIPGRILKEAPPEGGAKNLCYAVAFDDDALPERTQLALFLYQGD